VDVGQGGTGRKQGEEAASSGGSFILKSSEHHVWKKINTNYTFASITFFFFCEKFVNDGVSATSGVIFKPSTHFEYLLK